MIKTPISVQDLRRRIYVKAKAEPTWRFWGLYVHICKMETLQEAYQMAKSNNGAPGIDGVTFETIEESGVESFLKQIQEELVHNTYRPMPVRKKEIPKDGGTKVRVLSIPTIRDRVVQGALKHILEPIFEADFQSGSYGYRPKRSAHEAVDRVAQAIVQGLTRIIDLDLRAYFDNVQHSVLLEKVARRVQDTSVMRLLKMILKSTGAKGVPQGGESLGPLTRCWGSNIERMRSGSSTTGGSACKSSGWNYIRIRHALLSSGVLLPQVGSNVGRASRRLSTFWGSRTSVDKPERPASSWCCARPSASDSSPN
jgi:RNA-directed DNA polymerase